MTSHSTQVSASCQDQRAATVFSIPQENAVTLVDGTVADLPPLAPDEQPDLLITRVERRFEQHVTDARGQQKIAYTSTRTSTISVAERWRVILRWSLLGMVTAFLLWKFDAAAALLKVLPMIVPGAPS